MSAIAMIIGASLLHVRILPSSLDPHYGLFDYLRRGRRRGRGRGRLGVGPVLGFVLGRHAESFRR
jgi:hypothetical protein